MDPFRTNPEDYPVTEEDFHSACYNTLLDIGTLACKIHMAAENLRYYDVRAADLPEVERIHYDMCLLFNRLRPVCRALEITDDAVDPSQGRVSGPS